LLYEKAHVEANLTLKEDFTDQLNVLNQQLTENLRIEKVKFTESMKLNEELIANRENQKKN